MKMKLSLQEIRVKSFVTVTRGSRILGGIVVTEDTEDCTAFDCDPETFDDCYSDGCGPGKSSYPGGLSACSP